tara:strand:- start:7623 stop:8750 length:1128 start_codon:yes stop_codon:yes gene_type:complete
MLDINGDLSEAIDDQINKLTEDIWSQAMPSPSDEETLGTATKILLDLFEEDQSEEIYGLLRLHATGVVMSGEEDFGLDIRNKFYDEILEFIDLDEQTAEPKLADGSENKIENIIKGTTVLTLRALLDTTPDHTQSVDDFKSTEPTEPTEPRKSLRQRIKDLNTRMSQNYANYRMRIDENLLPSELLSKKPEIYRFIMIFLRKNLSKVNRVVKGMVEKELGNKYSKKLKNLEKELEIRTGAPNPQLDMPFSDTGGQQNLFGPLATENLNEEQLVTTVIDLEKLKSQEMNEIFLAQLGGAIEMILGFMFDNQPKSFSITGVPKDVKAFAGALGGEKKFIEAARKYGLNHPATYKNKAKLNNAIKKFEKQTGITWPFK